MLQLMSLSKVSLEVGFDNAEKQALIDQHLGQVQSQTVQSLLEQLKQQVGQEQIKNMVEDFPFINDLVSDLKSAGLKHMSLIFKDGDLSDVLTLQANLWDIFDKFIH